LSRPTALAIAGSLAAGVAQAHTGEVARNRLISGFTDPLSGWDHVVAGARETCVRVAAGADDAGGAAVRLTGRIIRS